MFEPYWSQIVSSVRNREVFSVGGKKILAGFSDRYRIPFRDSVPSSEHVLSYFFFV